MQDFDNGHTAKALNGGGLGAGVIGVAAAQFDAQRTYQRMQALQIALQAAGGPRQVSALIDDATAILTWLDTKSAAA